MRLSIDSYALLQSIGAHPETFMGVSALVQKQAKAILAAQFKLKTFDLTNLKAIRVAVGEDTFELFLEASELILLKGATKKIDPKWSGAKAADAGAFRSHISALAKGTILPEIASAAPKGKAAEKRPESGGLGEDLPFEIARKPGKR